MDYQSITNYIGKTCKIILTNSFWYEAKIIDVQKHSVKFIEKKGRTVTVEPSFIQMISEVEA